VNEPGGLNRYPGSPMIARHLLRRQDRLSAVELHPQDAARLKAVFDGDFQTRVMQLDGWLALGAHLPPKEKRGLVLIDPPFEAEGEFERLADGLHRAHRRWPGGIYALWYPIKDRGAVAAFRRALAESGIPKILDVAFEVRPPSPEPRLDGSGLIVVNPPFTLERDLGTIFPALHKLLALDRRSAWSLDWLAGEAHTA
jgi:23S rRNA (adenine2030-N6)-methyltransferase